MAWRDYLPKDWERHHDGIWNAAERDWHEGRVTLDTLNDVAGKKARRYARSRHPAKPADYAGLVLDYVMIYTNAVTGAAIDQAKSEGLAADIHNPCPFA